MKRPLCLLCGLLLLTACASGGPEAPAPMPPATPAETVRPTPEPALEESIFPRSFTFSSGAGAWSTELQVEADGSFTGFYHDSEMGLYGDDFPNGTQYRCSFSGTFAQPEPVNAFTWSTRLESIALERTPGEEEIEEGVRVIYSEPYGLEDADEILIYLPGAPVAELPEEFVQWAWAGQEETLPFYGLYNMEAQNGFVSLEPGPSGAER